MLRQMLDVLGFVAAFVLLMTALRMLHRCRRGEVSANSMLALALGIAAACGVVRALGVQPMDPAHVLLLVVGATWALRLTKLRKGTNDVRRGAME